MKKITLLFSSLLVGLALTILWLSLPEPCAACGSQVPPPVCTFNMTGLTVNSTTSRKVWWNFVDSRPERSANVYLGINHNQGPNPVKFTYHISYKGDWNPDDSGGITPTDGTGVLGPAGESNANQTIQISVPYSETQNGSLTITATVTSPDGSCPFSSQPLNTTLRLNQQGPTVWPVTPRVCPKPGEKPTLEFGVRNSGSEKQSYLVSASAYNPFGGSVSDLFSLNSQGSDATLPVLEVEAGKEELIKVSCETFGYCITGGENRVDLLVTPVQANPNNQYEAIASSNVTIRDPRTICPDVKDFWFFMPLGLVAFLWTAGAGVPGVVAIYLMSRKRGGGGSNDTIIIPPLTEDSDPSQPPIGGIRRG